MRIVRSFIGVSILFMVLATVADAKVDISSKKSKDTPKQKLKAYMKFTQILSLIESQYVDDVNTSTLVTKALKGLMSNLDAHSTYMDEKSFKELNIQTRGELGGLGISVGMKDGALTVIAPIDGTPAEKAGLKSGDIILKINDKATLGMSIDESVKLMRGKPGTDIELTIIRRSEAKPLKFKITRDIIKIKSVYDKTIGDDVLYLHITSFDQKVVKGVKDAIAKHPKAKGIILDLRNNPGGLLEQAVGLVDMFVPKGTVVSQRGKVSSENIEYKAHTYGTDTKTPIVTIINGGSASASEIVSGALQDFNRSVIVGEKSFGKGSVQIVLPIGKKEAIKLTVARYYLPSGRTIQNVGVTPSIIVHPGKIEHHKDMILLKEKDLKKHLQSELIKLDGKKLNKEANATAADANATKADKGIISEEMLYDDAQLKSAVDILKALIITEKR